MKGFWEYVVDYFVSLLFLGWLKIVENVKVIDLEVMKK